MAFRIPATQFLRGNLRSHIFGNSNYLLRTLDHNCNMRIIGLNNGRLMSSIDKQSRTSRVIKKPEFDLVKQNESVLEKAYEDKIRIKEPVTAGEKIKAASVDLTHFLLCGVGVVIFGGIGYFIYKDVFAPSSARRIFKEALKECHKNEQVLQFVGQPIKARGGQSSVRGRRNQVDHTEYKKDGHEYIRILFYLQGPNRNCEVLAEVKKKDETSLFSWDYEFVFIFLESSLGEKLTVVDNVGFDNA